METDIDALPDSDDPQDGPDVKNDPVPDEDKDAEAPSGVHP